MRDAKRAVAAVTATLAILVAVPVVRGVSTWRAIRKINAAGGAVGSHADPAPFGAHWPASLHRAFLELYPVRAGYQVSFIPPGWCGVGMTLIEAPTAIGDPGDAGLATVSGLRGIGSLDLTGTSVSDAGLVWLEGLDALESLGLAGTRVTGAGLVRLRNRSIRSLSLARTAVDDAALAQLADSRCSGGSTSERRA
jgi:hypothetical protein